MTEVTRIIEHAEPDVIAIPSASSSLDLLALDEALTALEQKWPEKATLVKLRYFAGLTNQEAAQALGVSRATVERYWTFARTELERRLKAAPASLELAGELADLLLDLAENNSEHAERWTVVKPTEIRSEGGATLTLQKDGSILVEGENPEHDTYTISTNVERKPIKAIRREALPDSSLPHGGPGRYAGSGNFHLNEFRVMIGDTAMTVASCVGRPSEVN